MSSPLAVNGVPVQRQYWPPAAPAAVEDALRLARRRGQLVAVKRLPTPDGRLAAQVVLRPARIVQAQPRRHGPARRWLLAAGVLVGFAVLGTLAWAVWVAVAWVVAHWLAILGTVAGLTLAWAAISGAFGGGGHGHCSGANTGH